MLKYVQGSVMFSSAKALKSLSSALSLASSTILRNQSKILQQNVTRSCSVLSRLRSSSSVKVLGAKRVNAFSKTCSCAIHHKLTEGTMHFIRPCFSISSVCKIFSFLYIAVLLRNGTLHVRGPKSTQIMSSLHTASLE